MTEEMAPNGTAPTPAKRARKAKRIAAIDVGTNSIHMVIVECRRHGYRVIDREKEMVQLGRGSLDGRPLTDDAIERGVATIAKMAEIARRWNAADIQAVATSAIREAPNRRRFLTAVERVAGIRVKVISGEEEADLIYRAVRAAVEFHGGTALTVDIGGGSVELIVGTEREVFFTRSEAAGALRIAQKFALDRATGEGAIDSCRAFVRKALKKTLGRIRALGFDFAIGTSGTIATLAQIEAMNAGDGGVASGLQWLGRTRLTEVIGELAPLSVAERCERFDLDEQRAETILGGAIVLDEIMDGLALERLRACAVALREGIVERWIDTEEAGKPKAPRGNVRRSSVLALAERSGVDMLHASHVARLAHRIFDQTAELHGLGVGERELLEYAALLHESGMHVSFEQHHKHSYYLISHAGLRGFTADQVASLANVARYYRKAPPRDEHDNFASLSASQQDVVRKLAAILRVAAALDRGRHRAVRDVAIHARGDTLGLELRPRGRVDIELEAVNRKLKFFSRVFERKVELALAAR